MAKQQQSSTELSRTLAGQWTKSEKREHASREIMEAKKRAYQAVKAVKQNAILSR